jgi:hypothetical protein
LDPDLVVLDVDATLVLAHSEKQGGVGTRKKTFGFHPIGLWCDNTTELLALTLRPGNAGSNTVTDHVEVLTTAIEQLPAANRRQLLVRVDGAGASYGLLDRPTKQDTKPAAACSIRSGSPITDPVRQAITGCPRRRGRSPWTPTGRCARPRRRRRAHRPARPDVLALGHAGDRAP